MCLYLNPYCHLSNIFPTTSFQKLVNFISFIAGIKGKKDERPLLNISLSSLCCSFYAFKQFQFLLSFHSTTTAMPKATKTSPPDSQMALANQEGHCRILAFLILF